MAGLAAGALAAVTLGPLAKFIFKPEAIIPRLPKLRKDLYSLAGYATKYGKGDYGGMLRQAITGPRHSEYDYLSNITSYDSRNFHRARLAGGPARLAILPGGPVRRSGRGVMKPYYHRRRRMHQSDNYG